MEKLFKFGNSIYSILMLFWLYFSIYYLFEFLNIDYTSLKSAQAKLLLSIFLGGIGMVHFKQLRKKVIQLFSNIYIFIVTHKLLVMLALFIFQMIILLTSIGLAKADTTVLYNIATDPIFASETDYISLFPNNFMLLIWMKLNYLLFNENMVVSMGLFNILFVNIAIYNIYVLNLRHLTKKTANLSFLLGILILGLSPQYIYTYSDSITLFLLSMFLLCLSKLARNREYKNAILSGILMALTYSFRPTVMIFIIAGFIVILFQWTKSKKILKSLRIWMKLIIVLLGAFLLINKAIDYSMNHQNIVKYETEKSRTLLYFVNLGLTYSGNIHAELPQEVVNATGNDRNKKAIEDIKKRIKQYDFTSFIGHLFYKYYWITNEGLIGWQQENVLGEEQRLYIPWLKNIQDKELSKWIRSYIYVDGENHYLYATLIQLIWIFISFGLFAYSLHFTFNKSYSLFMQITIFGAIIFLMIFEGGRTRYLIQFLPAILTISTQGLINSYQKIYNIRKCSQK
ncbi:hypothetical protein GRB29_01115 [Streptococcus pneumoniae]|nr:hypothetical protein [Streptococcus pneumoniae]